MPLHRQVTIGSAAGLHARPARLFCTAAAQQPVEITIAAGGRPPVDARSVLQVLALGIGGGEEVTLTGPDQPEGETALESLAALLAGELDAVPQ